MADAQVSPEDHKKHHPQAPAVGQSATSQPPGEDGGMMKGMMDGMGGSKQKEFYPSLMLLPELSDIARAELLSKARDRMKNGAALMNKAIIDLTSAAEENDHALMKEASSALGEGLAQFDSGVATEEALSAGTSPQAIGLAWFKENLNLNRPSEANQNRTAFFGLSFFHLFIMTLLAVFFLVMLAMYFLKMRRATKLLTWLRRGDTVPPAPSQPVAGVAPVVSESRWKGKLKVAAITEETPTVKTFRLVSPDGMQSYRPF